MPLRYDVLRNDPDPAVTERRGAASSKLGARRAGFTCGKASTVRSSRRSRIRASDKGRGTWVSCSRTKDVNRHRPNRAPHRRLLRHRQAR
eukprot:5662666-Prymnesium_polylepis.1